MKTFVHCDSKGTIHAVVTVDAPEGVAAMLEPEPGLVVAEIEKPGLEAATGDEKQVEKLRDILKNYKVKPASEPHYTLTKSH